MLFWTDFICFRDFEVWTDFTPISHFFDMSSNGSDTYSIRDELFGIEIEMIWNGIGSIFDWFWICFEGIWYILYIPIYIP